MLIPPDEPTRRTRALTIACMLLAGSPSGLAQTLGTDTPNPITDRAASSSGASFEGVNLPVRAREGAIVCAAARAWAWRVGSTRRLLLDRDVRVTLGPFTFDADRAAVWLEPITLIEPGVPEREAYQVAAYFDRVRTPAGVPGIVQDGERLLVTGVLVGAPPTLGADRYFDRAAPVTPFLTDAEARLGRHLDAIRGRDAAPQAARPMFELPSREGEAPVRVAMGDDAPRPGARLRVDADSPLQRVEGERGVARIGPARPVEQDRQPARRVDTREVIPQYTRTEPMTPARRRLYPDTRGRIQVLEDGDERIVLITGGATLSVTPPNPLVERALQLRAERAVVFLTRENDGPLSTVGLDVGDVAGVYLEGDVSATDGRYTLRGAQVFYNPANDRAVVLDGVFSSVDERANVPVYARAAEIRQLSLDEWRASDVTLANVAFAEPHFSIGATDVTITLPQRGSGSGVGGGVGDGTGIAGTGTGTLEGRGRGTAPYIEARDVNFQIGGLSTIGVPKLSGSIERTALRDIRYENLAGDNAIRTRWDLFTLTGTPEKEGASAELLVDGFIERGPALGLDLSWDRPGVLGGLFAYGIYDSGTDELSSGADIDRDGEFRGVVTSETAWRIDDEWTLFFETSYISDEAFIDSFFDNEAETRREFTNSLQARRLRNNELISLELRGSLNDFIPNEDLLQSQGYQTERLPELRYARIAQDLGALSYTATAQAGYLRFNFHDPELREIGLDTADRANAAFGLAPNDRLSDQLRAMGLDEGTVGRFDTRHEIEMPMDLGPFSFVPFAVGRFTAYDDGFDDFRGPNNDDAEDYRLWSAVGARLATSLVKTDTAVSSRLFDHDAIRHIIEPSVTFWQGASSVDPELLPVYDPDVESLADGTVVRVGARSTWQTKRGGAFAEGGRYTTDWLTLNANFVWVSEDTPIESPVGFFFESRPERSNMGDHFQGDFVLRLTDAISITGDLVHSMETDRTARVAGGLSIDHGYGFSTFVQYRSLEGFDATRLRGGAVYELTRKYAAELSTTWDLDNDEFQRFGVDLARRFPQWTIAVGFGVDNVSDNFTVGVTARPVGFGAERRGRLYTDDDSPFYPDRSPSSLRTRSAIGGPFRAG